jgi:hypothetical protein
MKENHAEVLQGNGNPITGNGKWILKPQNLIREVVAEM